MKILDVPQSGSLAGQTSSHNRYGQYRRTRAIPVNPNSARQQVLRAIVTSNSAAWRLLAAEDRSAWGSLGDSIVRTDALGQTYTLTGFQAFCLVNANNLLAGNAVVDTPPSLLLPDALTTLTPTLTTAACSLVYAPTPLAAGQRAFVYASPQRSAGRQFESDLRLIHVTGAAAASPANIFSSYEARFGTPTADNRVFFSVRVYDSGFLSAPIATSAIVVAA